jgi:hypothetical protein
MGIEIVVRTIRESRDLSPTEWKEVFEIPCSKRIVRESLFRDFDKPDFLRFESENFGEESILFTEPDFKILCIRSWLAEILDLDLFELSCSENEVLRSDLVAKCLSTLSHTEWDLLAR